MGLNIIIEKNIPFATGLFEPYATVRYLAPADITANAMADADALITRTRTRCDESLLKGSKCSIIASATIGLDHIDTAYCRKHGIEVANAPGCNAPAVAQYVMSSILSIKGPDVTGLTIGIVGAGHVGSIVADWSAQLGMNVLKCDPPRAEAEGNAGFTTMEVIAEKANIITFHTPYTVSGPHPTHHLCDAEFIASLRQRPVIINSARGPVADTAALVEACDAGFASHVVVDCWEHEPDIDRRLLNAATIATPHIAGYSREGKIRATSMAAQAVAIHFGLPVPTMSDCVPDGAARKVTAESILRSYDPATDTLSLKSAPEAFESLRNNYRLRHEVI